MSRYLPRIFSAAVLIVFFTGFCFAELPEPSPSHLPRWRGFNLLERFNAAYPKPFREEDFAFISELGFNFVRLPMDYRTWISNKDWSRLDESGLREVDKAMEYGRKYGVHVCVNFHRAPGYCVNPPAEPAVLWTDETAQKICAMHWAAFARRYKGIDNKHLSFNLFNEPARVEEAAYAAVVKRMVDAIHAEDPNRLVIVDGLKYGTAPVPSLAAFGVAEATRGYIPMGVSHFQAKWVQGNDVWPTPTWPINTAPQYFYGPFKKESQSAMTIKGDFARETTLRMHIGTVSNKALLAVLANGKELFSHSFVPGPGAGEWKEPHWSDQWKIWQNRYDCDFFTNIPEGTKSLEIVNQDGDWLTMTEIGLKPKDGINENVLRMAIADIAARQGEVRWDPKANIPFVTDSKTDADALWKEQISPWLEMQKTRKVGVFVGEWGAFNKTPHPIVLSWMEDCLRNWKKADWGWALWNFRGSFGILDSERADVQYEEFHGHKLDRAMLNLLQKY